MIKQINHIQLRAARHALNMSAKDIGELLGVGATTLASHERLQFGIKGANKFISKFSDQLIEFFAEHNIIFPDEYSIELKVSNDILNSMSKTCDGLTRFQLKIARYVLNISQKELAELAYISLDALSFQERKKNSEVLYISKNRNSTGLKLTSCFLSHGIEFIGSFKVDFKKISSIKQS